MVKQLSIYQIIPIIGQATRVEEILDKYELTPEQRPKIRKFLNKKKRIINKFFKNYIV